jgi:membrane protein YdbS with pleckstrin-like domain
MAHGWLLLQEDFAMTPEMQKQQFQLLLPTLICVALIVILQAFQRHMPWWLALSFYGVLTVVCIMNAVRYFRWRKEHRDEL